MIGAQSDNYDQKKEQLFEYIYNCNCGQTDDIPDELTFPDWQKSVNKDGDIPLMEWMVQSHSYQLLAYIPDKLFYEGCEYHRNDHGWTPLELWLILHNFNYTSAPQQLKYDNWIQNSVGCFKEQIRARLFHFIHGNGSLRTDCIEKNNCCICNKCDVDCMSLDETIEQSIRECGKVVKPNQQDCELFACIECIISILHNIMEKYKQKTAAEKQAEQDEMQDEEQDEDQLEESSERE